MYEPKISIVIPVFNGSNYLREAIDSALRQTYTKHEIIVVNDGSCDNGKTEKIIKSYGNKIRYIYKENGGVASALNIAIRNMDGEYFAWLSHDDLLKDNAMEIYVGYLQNTDKDCLLYGNYDLIDENSIIYKEVDFQTFYTKKELENSVYPVIKGCVNGCACLIQKSHFERVGLFDESLKITQDNDMWFRIFRNSKILFCKEKLSSKRYHSEQDSVIKNIYPEEDRFIESCLKDLSIVECSNFSGTVYTFFNDVLQSYNDNKHPHVTEFCTEKLKKINNGDIYNEYSAMELKLLLMNEDRYLSKINSDFKALQQKYYNYILRF